VGVGEPLPGPAVGEEVGDEVGEEVGEELGDEVGEAVGEDEGEDEGVPSADAEPAVSDSDVAASPAATTGMSTRLTGRFMPPLPG
jgi:hypothetical protein